MNSFSFEKGSPGSLLLSDGWEYPEVWGVKNSEPIARITLPKLDINPEKSVSLNFYCNCSSNVTVKINGNWFENWQPSKGFSILKIDITDKNLLFKEEFISLEFIAEASKCLSIASLWVDGGDFNNGDQISNQAIRTPLDPESQTHFFITGIPRSGTSITYKILCDALEIENSSLAESFFFTWAFTGFKQKFSEDCANAFLGNEFSGLFNQFRLENFSRPNFNDISILSRYYYQLAALRYGSNCIVDKTPENIFYWKSIFSSFPNAKIIFCTRNALDVYASYKKREQSTNRQDPNSKNKSWLLIDCNNFCTIYKQYIQAALSIKKEKINFLIIDYKKLTTRDPSTLKNLSDFIGCSYEKLHIALDKPTKVNSLASYASDGGTLKENRINFYDFLNKEEIKLLSEIESISE